MAAPSEVKADGVNGRNGFWGGKGFPDKEGIAVPGVFARRVAAKEVLNHHEALSHPCYPRNPWFKLLFLGSTV